MLWRGGLAESLLLSQHQSITNLLEVFVLLLALFENIEGGDSGFVGENVPRDFFQNGLARRLLDELLIRIVVVDIISNSEKFLVPITHRHNQSSHSQQILFVGDEF